jgi:hypothetical protein
LSLSLIEVAVMALWKVEDWVDEAAVLLVTAAEVLVGSSADSKFDPLPPMVVSVPAGTVIDDDDRLVLLVTTWLKLSASLPAAS